LQWNFKTSFINGFNNVTGVSLRLNREIILDRRRGAVFASEETDSPRHATKNECGLLIKMVQFAPSCQFKIISKHYWALSIKNLLEVLNWEETWFIPRVLCKSWTLADESSKRSQRTWFSCKYVVCWLRKGKGISISEVKDSHARWKYLRKNFRSNLQKHFAFQKKFSYLCIFSWLPRFPGKWKWNNLSQQVSTGFSDKFG